MELTRWIRVIGQFSNKSCSDDDWYNEQRRSSQNCHQCQFLSHGHPQRPTVVSRNISSEWHSPYQIFRITNTSKKVFPQILKTPVTEIMVSSSTGYFESEIAHASVTGLHWKTCTRSSGVVNKTTKAMIPNITYLLLRPNCGAIPMRFWSTNHLCPSFLNHCSTINACQNNDRFYCQGRDSSSLQTRSQ